VADDRRSSTLVLLRGLAALGGAVLLLRLGVAAIDAHSPDEDSWGLTHARTYHFRALIPELAARDEPTAIALGGSQMQGLWPEVFDAALAAAGRRVVTYNLSYGGLSPDALRILVGRLRNAFAQRGRRMRLAIVEFVPQGATRAIQRDGRWFDLAAMELNEPSDFVAQFRASREDTVRRGVARYLLGGVPPRMLKGWATRVLYGRRIMCGIPVSDLDDPGEQRAILRWCGEMHRVFPDGIPAWDLRTRGYPRQVFPETEAGYREMLRFATTEQSMSDDRDFRVHCCDMIDLDFDPKLLDDFVASLEELKTVAEHVLVVISPIHQKWVKPSALGEPRLRAAIARIERDTGLRVLDLSAAPEIADSDFVDVTHLNQLGGTAAFSRLVAARAAELLPADR
jgi:hypothetical protein